MQFSTINYIIYVPHVGVLVLLFEVVFLSLRLFTLLCFSGQTAYAVLLEPLPFLGGGASSLASPFSMMLPLFDII